jgi:hypothetical protein
MSPGLPSTPGWNFPWPGRYRDGMDSRLRSIYLQDHLAAATGISELAKRAAGSNRHGELGELLARLAREIDEDHHALLDVMGELGVRPDPVKRSFAWTAEKVGRLKPNGRLLGYSPLSRVTELEGLHLGISHKLSLWQVLEATSAAEIASADPGELIARARSQLADLEPHRIAAAREAFAGEPAPSG